MDDVATCVFKKYVYQTHILHRVILKHMPENRKHNYYPEYFYENPKLLCTSEMATVDALVYHEHYIKKHRAWYQTHIQKIRSYAMRWCVLCVTASCIRSATF